MRKANNKDLRADAGMQPLQPDAQARICQLLLLVLSHPVTPGHLPQLCIPSSKANLKSFARNRNLPQRSFTPESKKSNFPVVITFMRRHGISRANALFLMKRKPIEATEFQQTNATMHDINFFWNRFLRTVPGTASAKQLLLLCCYMSALGLLRKEPSCNRHVSAKAMALCALKSTGHNGACGGKLPS